MSEPRRRLDCLPGGVNEARPCHWEGCKHHLRGGECTLDHASLGGLSRVETATLLGMTLADLEREEEIALKRLRTGFGERPL